MGEQMRVKQRRGNREKRGRRDQSWSFLLMVLVGGSEGGDFLRQEKDSILV